MACALLHAMRMKPLDLAKTAVLVVDMQNAFVDPQGSLAKMGVPVARTKLPIPHILRILDKARAAKVPVVHLRMILRKDFADLGILGKVFPPLRELGHCAEGSRDADFVPELQPVPGDFVIDKNRFSGFFQTKLDVTLRCLGVSTLIVTGIATNVCVEGTVRDAFHRDYRVIVPREATASYTPEMEAGAFANFEFAYAEVPSVDELVATLTGS